MKQRESRYFIDIKHIVIERNRKLSKQKALTTFLSATIRTLGEKYSFTDVENRNLDHYIHDYVGYIVQKKLLLQKDLKSILFDALICLKATVPALPDLNNLKKHEIQEYDALVEKKLSSMQLYSIKPEAKEDIEQLFQSPYEFKFYCFSKYPFKEELLRSLIGAKLPEISQYLSFHTFSSMGNRDYIVTAEPRAGGFHKLNLIYYSCDDMPIFRKLTHEHEMGGFNVAAEIVTLSQLEDTITYIREAETRPKSEGKTIKIGYAFKKKKALQLQSNKRLLASRFPLEFIPVDLRMPLNREIDVFFHKITDQMNDNSDPFKEVRLYNFEKIRENKKILLMDSTESLKILSDRQVCQDFVSDVFLAQPFVEGIKKVSEEKLSFDVPKMCHVDPQKVKPEEISEVVHKEKMKFPIVVKTVTACGDKNSHMMGLAINMEGLVEIEKDALYREYTHVLQEYIEHDERIYKVYGIGDTIHIQQKQSLPNLLDKNLTINHFFFNSQHAMTENPQFSALSKGFEALEINLEAVRVLVHILGEKLGLSMAGYDLIRETKTGTYYLIDINYFPGFKGFKDVRNVLDQHFINSYKKHIGAQDTKTA